MESTSSDVDHTGEMAGRPSTTPPRSSRAANDTGPRSPPNADRQPSAWDPEIWKEMRGAFPVNRDLRELPPSHFREAPPSPASTSSTANTGTIAIHDGQCSSQQTPSVEVTGAGVLRPNKRRRTTPSVDGEAEPTTDDEYSVDMVSLQIQDTPSQQPANMPPSSPTKAMEYWLNEARRLRNKSPLRTQAPGWPEMVRTKPSGKNQSPEPGTTRRSSPKPLEKNTSEPIATHLPSPKPTAKRLPEAATILTTSISEDIPTATTSIRDPSTTNTHSSSASDCIVFDTADTATPSLRVLRHYWPCSTLHPKLANQLPTEKAMWQTSGPLQKVKKHYIGPSVNEALPILIVGKTMWEEHHPVDLVE
ncbi:hypothetical protein M011DRAFT_483814 [Sporormia fimetaria CBS 119925]|uniref:Uncharacterized protein n=1 Tax=Sporormia fimetaria CBS 119925 TaxID=1340428 RepID=A0A6A6VMX4_9PLEO|nr:hypothetical protein M011DRAFT_483814 [Sporormia fimetaria CBS 119925]